tara:strand:+ start:22490 stop:22990 length:501 start_codon:yes stop_codon:yes gene_type:complete
VVIENDSIKFNYPYFDYWNKYPLSIKRGSFKFNGISLTASIEKDTLTLSDSIYYIKDDLDTLYGYKPLLKIDLPQISELIKTTEKYDDIINFVYFGKRLDSEKFSLQLNDNYAELQELPGFLSYTRPYRGEELIPFHSTYLFIDETTPMKDVEEIFYRSHLDFLSL